MTSKLKCPFCQTELEDAGIHSPELYFCCTNCYMKQKEKDDNYTASPRIWQALIQAKQDLEIARKALENIKNNYEEHTGAESVGFTINWDVAAKKMHDCADKALTQIEHKE